MENKRVFYSVVFNNSTKDELAKCRDLLINNSIKGNFISTDNFHLTLEFIGEVNQKQLDKLRVILHKIKEYPKELILSNIGTFRKKNKDVVWIGVEKNDKLISTHQYLRELLIEYGFEVENTKYHPHITLGREVVMTESIQKMRINSIKAPILSIAIMESKRENGKLIYKPIEELVLKR